WSIMKCFSNSDIRRYQADIKFSKLTPEEIISSRSCKKKMISGEKAVVFLSFSNADIDDVAPVIKFLEDFDVSVCIDYSGLGRKETSGKSICERKIRQIKNCEKYIVLISKRSVNSKWLAWELGLAAEMKSMQNIAILARSVSFAVPPWARSDYLEFYPKICFNNYEWMVCDGAMEKFIPFKEWLFPFS
ncbi:MAG TPA: toll/interleukin-1 receptor domain-containing protein, partial [bacterium]|nr:toll/interleukin-1 receptor domain-containing protein [bacterium]